MHSKTINIVNEQTTHTIQMLRTETQYKFIYNTSVLRKYIRYFLNDA